MSHSASSTTHSMPSEKMTPFSDSLTVLILKDNYAARTFQVPLRWITQLGLGLSLLGVLFLTSVFFAIKFYQIARTSDPLKVQNLEKQLTELRAVYQAQEIQAVHTPPVPTISVPPPVVTAPTSTHLPEPFLFSAFPPEVKPFNLDPSTVIPISLSSRKVFWRGKSLQVHFAIQYVREDKGGQQGKIVLLARGPETLLAYPERVLNPGGKTSLFSPKEGEFFSVSRYREVIAEFPVVPSNQALKEVEIFIFNSALELLIHDSLKVDQPSQPMSTSIQTPQQPIPAVSSTPKTKDTHSTP